MRSFFLSLFSLSLLFSISTCTLIIDIGNVSPPDAAPPDAAPPDAACVAESDMELCAGIADACEGHTAIDSCGVQRTVDCGGCTGGRGCVVGTCKTPVCTSFNFASAPIPAFTRAGNQDQVSAATPDGRVVLILQALSGCSGFRLIVSDETAPGSGAFTLRDVTAAFNALGYFIDGESYTITADGLTIVGRSADWRRLLATKRSAIDRIDFGPASIAGFDQINAQVAANAGMFRAPVISADGLELFYSITGAAAGVNGIYSSVRASPSMPFPAGVLIPATTQYQLVSGVSSDRLTLFVFEPFLSRVFTRNSTSRQFANPNAPNPPTVVMNWAHRPLADCSKLVAVASPGGCSNEDIVLMTRQ